MHVNVQTRFNAALGQEAPYFRFKESYRDIRGYVHSIIILNVGFEPELLPKQMFKIADALTDRFKNRNTSLLFSSLLTQLSEFERNKAEEYWHRMIKEGGIDRFNHQEKEAKKEAENYIDINTVKHTEAREVGAEWLCKQTIDKLGFADFLRSKGWTENKIRTTLSHLIVRTIYSQSELSSYHTMLDNSAACELCSDELGWTPGLNSLYKVTDDLFSIKTEIENYLCSQTDNLFNLENRIMLFDLTNFYFEGRKANSKKAKFGRSKEKRSDCKLLVLALCINKEGFIRYFSILAGNTADPDSLPDMVDTLNAKTRVPNEPKDKVLVCLDAGIATEENLQKIKEKGYNYLCVSRRRLTDYEIAPDAKTVTVLDSKQQPIKLTQVKHEEDGDYYLEIDSPAKQLKETSMNRKFKERFEEELQKAKESLTKKNGTKNYERVIERVGRARQKYPSISKYYVIDYIADDPENPKNMTDIQWHIAVPENVDKQSGIYFLRTNVPTFDEKTTWDYYNLTREIECTNRQLKTDLNLRPVHHKKDDRSDAHLFLGLLSYWIVNTIRYKLKQTGETCFWTEIVRRLSTQKAVTTEATNTLGEKVHMRLCSEPNKSADDIYERLKYKKMPFRKIKIEKSLLYTIPQMKIAKYWKAGKTDN